VFASTGAIIEAVESSIEFGGTPQDVTVTVTGLADAEGLVGLVRDLVSSPQFRPGMLMLEDVTAIDASRAPPFGLRWKGSSKLGEQIGPLKLAIVVPSPVTFGYARVWEAYVDDRTAIGTRMFYSRAVEWLEAKRAARLAAT
jgi:hypothetical protein